MDYNETVGYICTTSNIKYIYVFHLWQTGNCKGTNVSYITSEAILLSDILVDSFKKEFIRTLIEFETFLRYNKYARGTEKSQSVLWPYC